jgi:ABC-type transport system involved in cytochrome bd biosynthesis fused ATPase/permease subunit
MFVHAPKPQSFPSIDLLTLQDAAQVTAASNRILEARENQNRDIVADTEQIPDTEGGVEIEFQNVYFRYPTRDVSIFKDLNMHVSLLANIKVLGCVVVLIDSRYKKANLLLLLELQVCFSVTDTK